jgi:hypothetical protein
MRVLEFCKRFTFLAYIFGICASTAALSEFSLEVVASTAAGVAASRARRRRHAQTRVGAGGRHLNQSYEALAHSMHDNKRHSGIPHGQASPRIGHADIDSFEKVPTVATE